MNWAEDEGYDGYDFDEDETEEDEWLTREGKIIKIETMTDAHLYHAFKLTKDDRLRDEIVLRLFRNVALGGGK